MLYNQRDCLPRTHKFIDCILVRYIPYILVIYLQEEQGGRDSLQCDIQQGSHSGKGQFAITARWPLTTKLRPTGIYFYHEFDHQSSSCVSLLGRENVVCGKVSGTATVLNVYFSLKSILLNFALICS